MLDYFQEDHPTKKAENCCDVCSQNEPVDAHDAQEEVSAIIRAVQDIPHKGERKVCYSQGTIWYIHTYAYMYNGRYVSICTCRLLSGYEATEQISRAP